MSTAAVIAPVKSGFSFSSVGHALATGLHDAYLGVKVIETAIEKFDTPTNQVLVESLTSLIPSIGPAAVTVERGLFAVGGELASILHTVDSNGEQKLLDAGFDAKVIADFKALLASVPGLVKFAGLPVKA